MATLFSDSEIKLAETFMHDVKNKKFILEPTELKSNKGKNLYKSFIDLTISSKPKAYYQDDFTKLTEAEVIEAFTYTIFLLFGNNNEIKEEMEEFFKIITLSNDNEILSGIKLTWQDPKTKEFKSVVEVPSFNNTSSVVSLVHEFIHFHMSNKNIDLNKKYYYTEIFSIYGEKIASYIIESYLKIQNDMTEKVDNTRLEGLVWHYTDRFKEISDLQKMYNANKKNPFINKEMLDEMERQCPWLNNPKMKEAYNAFRDNLAYSYGFGYIYAEALYRKFEEDYEKTGYDIRQVLEGKERIEKLLKDYNIGINQPTVTTAKQKVKKITQK